MLIYLDKFVLTGLLRDPESRAWLQGACTRHKLSLGVGFAHVLEIAKDVSSLRVETCSLLSSLPTVQLRPLVFIMADEFRNEVCRFLQLEQRNPNPTIGSIFEGSLKESSIGELVDLVSGGRNEAIRQVQDHARKMSELMEETAKRSIGYEREQALKHYMNNDFSDTENLGLSVHLPRGTPNAQEFIAAFDWNGSPYMSLYVAFQDLRYRDRRRDPKPSDLADGEHAVMGRLACDFLIIEKNARAILEQAVTTCGVASRSRVFGSLQEFRSLMDREPPQETGANS